MRLLTFAIPGSTPQPGLADGDEIVDLSVAAPDLPRDWRAIFGTAAMDRLPEILESASEDARIAREAVQLLPPVPVPNKIVCCGLNYHAHAAETGNAPPEKPVFFMRVPTSLCGHGQPMLLPRVSEQLDYEVELAIVIGTGGRYIDQERSLDHVAGYSIFNDGSVRDYQMRGQWTLGKNFDQTGPFGPEIVTPDELPEGADGLAISLSVDDEILQDGNTSDMIFDCKRLVADVSEVMTLEPGDVIITGTPPGVGLGREPKRWLKPGETVSCHIEGIGLLVNEVLAEE